MAAAAQADLSDELHEFLDRYYSDDIGTLAQRYPSDQKSLVIDYDDLFRFDPDIAEDYVEKPTQMDDYLEQALADYPLPADVDLSGAHVRVTNLPEYRERLVGKVDPEEDLDELVTIRGQVIEITDPKPRIEEAAYECGRCGTMSYVPTSDRYAAEPHECQGCERQGPFSLNEAQSSMTKYQRLRVQKPPEEATHGQSTFDINVEDDLVQTVRAGNRVSIASVIDGRQETENGRNLATMEMYGNARSVTKEESDWSDADIDEHFDRIQEIAQSDDPYEMMMQSIKPSHQGHEPIKLAIALEMFQGVKKPLPDGSTKRGTINILLIGDPGVGKSEFLQYAKHVTPGAIYTDGSGSTKAGLTATAVQSDLDGGGWTIRGGALVKAHRSLAAIDELDDMEEEDAAGMKEAMSENTISVAKGDNNVTLPAQTSVLAAANPKFGRYDQYQPIGEQIDIEPALLSRFDLIFPVQDEIDPESDRELASHLNEMARVGQKMAAGEDLTQQEQEQAEPEIEPEVLRSYVAYARKNITPVLSEEAEEYIEEQYVQVRAAGEGEENAIPTTARNIEAVHRLAEASARIRLSETVTLADAKRVVDIWKECMEKIGIDPETGEYDADVIETGSSKTQRDRIKSVRGTIERYSKDPEYDLGAPEDELLEDLDSMGFDKERAKEQITELMDKGEIYEPKQGHYEIT